MNAKQMTLANMQFQKHIEELKIENIRTIFEFFEALLFSVSSV